MLELEVVVAEKYSIFLFLDLPEEILVVHQLKRKYNKRFELTQSIAM